MRAHGAREANPKSRDAEHNVAHYISRLFILAMDPIFKDFDSHATCHTSSAKPRNHA
jgi:hypothetical protein